MRIRNLIIGLAGLCASAAILVSASETKSGANTYPKTTVCLAVNHQTDTDHEEFFLTREEMDKRYKELFIRNEYALNPTAWERHVEDWTRIEGY